jgi:hypothetical protein
MRIINRGIKESVSIVLATTAKIHDQQYSPFLIVLSFVGRHRRIVSAL